MSFFELAIRFLLAIFIGAVAGFFIITALVFSTILLNWGSM